MKSVRLRTRDSHVLHRVKWSNKVVICSQGKPPVYEDISLPLFSNRYLSVVSEETPVIQGYMFTHLRQIFEDVEVYGWGSVQEYDATWLPVLMQGRASWSNEQKRAKLCCLMVCRRPSLSSRQSQLTSDSGTSDTRSQNSWWGAGRAMFYHLQNQVTRSAQGIIAAFAQATLHIIRTFISAAFV